MREGQVKRLEDHARLAGNLIANAELADSVKTILEEWKTLETGSNVIERAVYNLIDLLKEYPDFRNEIVRHLECLRDLLRNKYVMMPDVPAEVPDESRDTMG